MSNTIYEIKETNNQRWGIYLQDRLLATIGSYEACESVWQSLSKNLSYQKYMKSSIAYRKAIDKSLTINSR